MIQPEAKFVATDKEFQVEDSEKNQSHTLVCREYILRLKA